jgi:hypothetical protein
MKIKRTDAHDRIIQFKKQGDYISQGCTDCIKNRPEEFGNLPFYIFAHKREIGLDERTSIYNQDLMMALQDPLQMRKYWKVEDVPTHRYIWQPRLVKPTAQTNSMLFKAYPPTDKIKIIWIIPDRSMWGQYKKGNMTEQEDVSRSIHLFETNRKELEAKEEDDLSDEEVNRIYTEISQNAKFKRGS